MRVYASAAVCPTVRHVPGQLTTSITTAVAAERDLSPSDLPPLYDAVEPDALAALVGHLEDPAPSDLAVRFRYAGTTVTVDARGGVTVDADRQDATVATTSRD